MAKMDLLRDRVLSAIGSEHGQLFNAYLLDMRERAWVWFVFWAASAAVGLLASIVCLIAFRRSIAPFKRSCVIGDDVPDRSGGVYFFVAVLLVLSFSAGVAAMECWTDHQTPLAAYVRVFRR